MLASLIPGKWGLVLGGAAAIALGGMFLRMELAVSQRDNALTRAQNAEAQSAALAERLASEVAAHHQAKERERRIGDDRRLAREVAQREHERITDEIIESLGTEACALVPIPARAVDGLRAYAEYALRNRARDAMGTSAERTD